MQADVRSIEELTELKSALILITSDGRASVGATVSRFRLRLDRLRDVEVAASQDVEECRSDLETAGEDDDISALEYRLSSAVDRWAQIRSSNEGLANQLERCAQHASEYRDFLANTSARAISVLEEKLRHLEEYRSVKVGHEEPPSLGLTTHSSAQARNEERPPLPRGFVWMNLTDIDLPNELRDVRGPEDFKKVPYDQMKTGLERLRTDILPKLGEAGGDPKAYFREKDRQSGVDYANGSQRIFEAFFGDQEYVYLQRGRSDLLFSITNGRHRVMLARELGWEAIPAQVKDLRK